VGIASVALGAGRLKWEDPIDPKAGILLHKKCGDAVKKGETLMTLFTDNEDKTEEAMAKIKHAVGISAQKPQTEDLIYTYLDKTNLS
jgi:pyrimidine-nucleoside phosphorylase